MSCKTKRRICVAIGFLCWLLMLFVVGGTERGYLPMTAIWCAFGLLAVGAFLLWKGGVIQVR